MEEINSWWETLDMKDPFLIKLWSGMHGTCEQRVQQLFIIRKVLNLKKK